MSETFETPKVLTNPTSWGPPESATNTKFNLLPYAPFGRSDRLGRAADFTQSNQYYNRRDRRGGDSNANAEFQYKEQADDFELVDTSKVVTRRSNLGMKKRANNQNRLRQLNARRGDGRNDGRNSYNKLQNTRGGRFGGRGGRGGRGGHRRNNWRERVDRQASVAVKPDWKMVVDMDLNKVSKGITNTETPKTEEDLLWCGFLDRYNDVYEKCSVRTPAVLKRSENKEFYPVTTTDDPVIENLAIDGQGTVFATDAILAHLMTCPRSAYPWDIVVQKLPNGALFFDKRDSSQFDYLTVHETANITPSITKSEDDPEGINTPERLSLEATMINQNFSQQILKSSKRKEFEHRNPFYDDEDDDGMEPASVAYRYRRFDLGNDIQLVCRTELHGIVKKTSGSTSSDQYMTAFALNEYFDSTKPYSKTNTPSAGMINWREKLDSQRGAVVGSELKNNAFKIAKWTAQSILANADQMKIGFVSRSVPKNAHEHQILGTQFYRPKDFAAQITLNEGNMWGIIRMFIGLFKDQSEGKYVIMRDPNKAQLKVYSVPAGTFESDDEDSD